MPKQRRSMPLRGGESDEECRMKLLHIYKGLKEKKGEAAALLFFSKIHRSLENRSISACEMMEITRSAYRLVNMKRGRY